MGAIADAIMAYGQPLIDSSDGSIEQLNKALAISQACWNLAIMPEGSRRSALDGLRSSLDMSDADFDDFERSVVLPMIRRHEEMFPGLHHREPRDSPHLRGALGSPHWETMLASAPITKLPKEKTSQPGRYDPCPCNSGKKYKFCCGRGRG